jgi:two-component system, sensor histidine kinase
MPFFGEDDVQDPSPLWSQVLHDLRQPIQTALLLTDVLSSTDDMVQRQRAALHLEAMLLGFQSMIEALAQLTELDSGRRTPGSTECAIAPVMQDVIESFDAVRGRLAVQITPCAVSTDIKLLGVVLTTMLHSALEADRSGPIRVEGQRTSGGYRIAVLFNGAVVSAAQQHALFLEVRQGDGPDAVSELLPGLGYVSRLAKLIGGSLGHAEKVDRSQSLTFLLPV